MRGKVWLLLRDQSESTRHVTLQDNYNTLCLWMIAWGWHDSSKLFQRPSSDIDRIKHRQHPGFSFTCDESKITFCIFRVTGSSCVSGPSNFAALLVVGATWETPGAAVAREPRRRLERPSLPVLAPFLRDVRAVSRGVACVIEVESVAASCSNITLVAKVIVPGSSGSFLCRGLCATVISATASNACT